MMDDKIKIFETPKKLAEAFAEYFSKRVSEADKYNIALSGGTTPKIIFQVLAEQYKDKIDWAKVNFYWGDERCVAPESDESNYGMTKSVLFDKIYIPQENIHRIIGEGTPEKEAERYSDLLIKNLPSQNGFPQFDFIMLGLGEDGHTASIFPDRLDLFESDNLCEAVEKPVTLQKRITITGNVINNSKVTAFFVTGASKSKIVRSVLKENKDKQFPASFVDPKQGELLWFLDFQAASLL
jgi:6-phosphogluconolactonase